MWKYLNYSVISNTGDSTSEEGFEDTSVDSESKILSIKHGNRRRHTEKFVALFMFLCFAFGFTTGMIGGPKIKKSLSTTKPSSSCIYPTTRREWRTLSHLERDAYRAAVTCMTTQQSSLNQTHTLYDDFAYVHTLKGDDTIMTAGFFPWHRYFMLSYETALRKHCNYAGHMPYWDWTLDWTDFHASPLWDPVTGFGGDGDKSAPESVGHGHCVTTGPFAGLRPLYYDRNISSHCLSRAWRTGETLEFAMSKIQPATIEDLMQRDDYHDFTHWLEKDVHKSMPYVIQGDWMQTSAPNDPIFWLAHVQLDRLWWLWQSRKPETRFSEMHGKSWVDPNKTASFSDELDVGGLLPNIQVRDVLRTDTDVMCYRY